MNDYQWKDLLMMAGIVNGVNILIILVSSRLAARPGRMRKQGYPDAYVEFTSAFSRRFGVQFALFMVLSQAGFFLLNFLVSVRDPSSDYLMYVFIPSLLLALPFALYKVIVMGKKYKELAEDTGEEIVADFGYTYLKRVFLWPLELGMSLFVLSFLMLHADWSRSAIILLYVALLWFFAGVARFSRNAIRPSFRDQYVKVGLFSLVYQGIMNYFLIMPLGLDLWDGLSGASRIAFVMLMVALTAKLAYYAVRYPRFSRDIKAA
jgi:hypothetical protein